MEAASGSLRMDLKHYSAIKKLSLRLELPGAEKNCLCALSMPQLVIAVVCLAVLGSGEKVSCSLCITEYISFSLFSFLIFGLG